MLLCKFLSVHYYVCGKVIIPAYLSVSRDSSVAGRNALFYRPSTDRIPAASKVNIIAVNDVFNCVTSSGNCAGREIALLYCRATVQPSPDGRAVSRAVRLRRAVAQLRSQGDCAVHILYMIHELHTS